MRRPFGTTRNGRSVEAISLHAGDLSVTILTLGAIVQDVRLAGLDHSLTIGSNDLAAYDGGPMLYAGALVGPVANRLSNAAATLNGATISLDANEGTTCLHGGPEGMHTEVWDVADVSETHVTLTLTLPDGKGGFPGIRSLRLRYSLDAPAHLRMTIEAETDADTLLNLANHSYWNLSGRTTNEGHTFISPAKRYVPIDDAGIPTGVNDVSSTEFDFRTARPVGKGNFGLDHNLCLPLQDGSLQHACTLRGPNGVEMRMETTEQGLQFYDGRAQTSGAFNGLHGKPYGPYSGIALEAQNWPDAPNQDGFPSIILRKGETYHQETVWTFSKP